MCNKIAKKIKLNNDPIGCILITKTWRAFPDTNLKHQIL